jgi:hypothetical protein
MNAVELVREGAESALQMRWVMADEGLRIQWTTTPIATNTERVIAFQELQERHAEAA